MTEEGLLERRYPNRSSHPRPGISRRPPAIGSNRLTGRTDGLIGLGP